MLTPFEVKERIKAGEDLKTEFKRSYHEDTSGPAIAAFATDYNRVGGGLLMIGVNPDKTIQGVTGDLDELQQKIINMCHIRCSPRI